MRDAQSGEAQPLASTSTPKKARSSFGKPYRPAPSASDRDRVEHLFGRYEALVNPLEREAVKQNKRVSRKAAKAK